MSEITDKRIQGFFDDLAALKAHQFEIVRACRGLVFELSPDAEERMMYGGIMFCANSEDFGGVFASKNHVSFEFGQGNELDDPNGFLEGKGKFRRHLKLKSVKDIDVLGVKSFVQQAISLVAQ